MRKRIYTLNILYALFQIALVLVVVDFFTPETHWGLIISSIVIIIMHLLIFLRNHQPNPFGKSTDITEIDVDQKYKDMIAKAEQLKGSPIKVKFIDYKRLHLPAFYHKGTVYINQNDRTFSPHFVEGMIAHELGHAISGYGDKYVLAQVKLTNIVRAFIVAIRMSLIERNGEINKRLEAFLYYLMKGVTWLDEIILFKYLRREEYQANKNACLISNGESLRVYYYHVHRRRRKQNYEFDVVHPSPKAMIIRMEKYMNLDQYNKDVYAVNDKIYYVVNKMNVKEQDIAKFNYYIHKGNKENPYVNNKISDCYYNGKGVEKDIEKALEFALIAEQQGSTKGYFNIARCYEKLDNLEKALEYYGKAKEEGSNMAIRKIAQIEKLLEESDDE